MCFSDAAKQNAIELYPAPRATAVTTPRREGSGRRSTSTISHSTIPATAKRPSSNPRTDTPAPYASWASTASAPNSAADSNTSATARSSCVRARI